MGRTLTFYGVSDDLFEIEGTTGREPDEIGTDDGAVKIESEHAGLIVCARYSPFRTGCWMIGIMQRHEDDPLPDWPMRWSVGGRGYSTRLEIDVPESAKVSQVRP